MELNEEEKRFGDDLMSHYFTGSRNQGEYRLMDAPGYRESIIIRNLPAGLKLRHLSEGEKTEAVCLAAVQEDGRALEYVPKAKKTEALCIEAMKHSRFSSGSGGSVYGVNLI